LKAGLGFQGDFHERFVGVVPGDDSPHVGGSPLIVDDEGVDAMAEALLHHYQPAHAAVIVLEGSDHLEFDVEIQNTLHVGRVLLVVLQEGSEARAYDFRGNTELLHGPAVFAGQDFLPAVGIGAVGEGVVELFDEGLGQWQGEVVNDISHGGEVVRRLDDIVHLHRLKAAEELVFAVDLLHQVPGEAVAGHAVG